MGSHRKRGAAENATVRSECLYRSGRCRNHGPSRGMVPPNRSRQFAGATDFRGGSFIPWSRSYAVAPTAASVPMVCQTFLDGSDKHQDWDDNRNWRVATESFLDQPNVHMNGQILTKVIAGAPTIDALSAVGWVPPSLSRQPGWVPGGRLPRPAFLPTISEMRTSCIIPAKPASADTLLRYCRQLAMCLTKVVPRGGPVTNRCGGADSCRGGEAVNSTSG